MLLNKEIDGGCARERGDLDDWCRCRGVSVFLRGSPLLQESEQLRLIAFEIYGTILAKVSRMTLVFPLRHQILSLLILLVAHLKDVNTDVVEVRSRTLEPGIQFSVDVNAEHGKPLDRAVAGLCNTERGH